MPLQPFFFKLVQVSFKQRSELSENLLALSTDYLTYLLKNDIPEESLKTLAKLLSKLQKRCKQQSFHQYVGLCANLLADMNLRMGNIKEALEYVQASANYYTKNNFFSASSQSFKYRKVYLSNRVSEVNCLRLLKVHSADIRAILDSSEEFCNKWLPTETWFFSWVAEVRQGLVKRTRMGRTKSQSMQNKTIQHKKQNSNVTFNKNTDLSKRESATSLGTTQHNILQKYFTYKRKQEMSITQNANSFKFDRDPYKETKNRQIYDYLLGKYGNKENYRIAVKEKKMFQKKEPTLEVEKSEIALEPAEPLVTTTVNTVKEPEPFNKELIEVLKTIMLRDNSTLKDLVESTQQLKNMITQIQQVPWMHPDYQHPKAYKMAEPCICENKPETPPYVNSIQVKILVEEGVQRTPESNDKRHNRTEESAKFNILINNKKVNIGEMKETSPPNQRKSNKKVEFSNKVEDMQLIHNIQINKVSVETRKSEINKSFLMNQDHPNFDMINDIPTTTNLTKLDLPRRTVVDIDAQSESSEDEDLSYELINNYGLNTNLELKVNKSRHTEISYNKSTARTNIFDVIEQKLNRFDYTIECEVLKFVWHEGQMLKLTIMNKLISADKLLINLYIEDKLVKTKTINRDGLRYLFKKVNYVDYIPFFYRANDQNCVNEIISSVLFQLINVKTTQEKIPQAQVHNAYPSQDIGNQVRKTLSDAYLRNRNSKIRALHNEKMANKNLTDTSKNSELPVKLSYSIDLNPIPVSLLPDTEIDLFGQKYLFSFVHLKGLLFRIYLHSLKPNKKIESCKQIDVSLQNQDFMTMCEINNEKMNFNAGYIKIKSSECIHIVDNLKEVVTRRLINILRAVYKKFDGHTDYKQLYDYLKLSSLEKSRYEFYRIYVKRQDKGFVAICATHDAEDGKLKSVHERHTLGDYSRTIPWSFTSYNTGPEIGKSFHFKALDNNSNKYNARQAIKV